MTIDHWQEIKGAARAHTVERVEMLEQRREDEMRRDAIATFDYRLIDSLYDRLDVIDRWHPERGEIPAPPPPPWAPRSKREWVGCDLDRTLAFYESPWKGAEHVGSPIPVMVERVKQVMANGYEVKILTARVSSSHPPDEVEKARTHIQIWCKHVFGQELEVTCEKDAAMVELWDDRAVGVAPNSGELLSASRLFPPPSTPQTELPGLGRVKRSRKRR